MPKLSESELRASIKLLSLTSEPLSSERLRDRAAALLKPTSSNHYLHEETKIEYPCSHWILSEIAFRKVLSAFLFRRTHIGLEDAVLKLESRATMLSEKNLVLLVTWLKQVEECRVLSKSKLDELRSFKNEYCKFTVKMIFSKQENDEIKQEEVEIASEEVVEMLSRIMKFIDEIAVILQADCPAVGLIISENFAEFKYSVTKILRGLTINRSKQEDVKTSENNSFGRSLSYSVLSPSSPINRLRSVSVLTGSLDERTKTPPIPTSPKPAYAKLSL